MKKHQSEVTNNMKRMWTNGVIIAKSFVTLEELRIVRECSTSKFEMIQSQNRKAVLVVLNMALKVEFIHKKE